MDRVSGPVTAEPRTVEKLIESCPTEMREVIETLRSTAKANMPGTHEFVYHDAFNYKLPEPPGTWICYIATQRNYVRLGFYFGANLSDPKQLLEGTGKRMRHIKVKTVGEATADELADLIRQAWADTLNTVASLNEKARRRQTEGDQS